MNSGRPSKALLQEQAHERPRVRLSIAFKLLFVLFVVAAGVIGFESWRQSQRAESFHVTRADAEQQLLATLTSAAIEKIWEHGGWESALAFLESVEKKLGDGTQLRWVWLDEPRVPYAPVVPLDLIQPLIDDPSDFTTYDLNQWGRKVRVSYQPLQIPKSPLGAIEIQTSTVPLSVFQAQERERSLAVGGLLILLLTLTAAVAGRLMVSAPMRSLADGLQKIASGELRYQSDLAHRRDEFGVIASEINSMTKTLAKAMREASQEQALRLQVEHHLQHADRQLTVATVQASYLHDTATPLSIILGHAGLIAMDDDASDETKEAAAAIREQAQRVDALLKRLRAAGAGRGGEATGTAQLRAVVVAIEHFLQPFFTSNGVTLTTDLQDGDIPIGLDALSTGQVLQNLLVNAVQASARGQDVRLTTSVREQMAVVKIEDDGQGMPPAVLERIFEPYFTTKPEGVGTGLGLYMVARLVERAGGDLSVESTADVGTCFTLSLPLLAPEDSRKNRRRKRKRAAPD